MTKNATYCKKQVSSQKCIFFVVQVAAQVKKPKYGPKPETECFYYKGTGHLKRNCPMYLADKKDGKVKGATN